MLLLKSFIFCGFVCFIGQIILVLTDWSPGHVTSLFVVIGSLLDCFSIYDKIVELVGGGALLPITSFGHSLAHAAISKTDLYGITGVFMGMFDLTATGITCAIIFSAIFTLFFKPKH